MRALADNVFSVGVIDWELRLFDRLIPLPDGTSYNSYVVKGSDKTALIDSVEPEHVDELIGHLVAAGIDKIDYLVALHGEQDHSGALPDMLVLYPDAKVVTNPKCKSMLIDLLDLEDEQIVGGGLPGDLGELRLAPDVLRQELHVFTKIRIVHVGPLRAKGDVDEQEGRDVEGDQRPRRKRRPLRVRGIGTGQEHGGRSGAATCGRVCGCACRPGGPSRGGTPRRRHSCWRRGVPRGGAP